MNNLIDISPPISPRLAVWPGDVPAQLEARARMIQGDSVDVSAIRMTLHLGSHADAPGHVRPGGAGMESVDLEPYLGRCQVIDVIVKAGERIGPEHLPGLVHAPRILFRTSTYPDPDRFTEDFAGLSPGLVRHLSAQGCRLIGLDTPSVDPYADGEFLTHHAMVECGIASLEGLVLHHVEPGLYTLIALPLRIEGGDASPVRAVLLRGRL